MTIICTIVRWEMWFLLLSIMVIIAHQISTGKSTTGRMLFEKQGGKKRREAMKPPALFLLVALLVPSCAHIPPSQTLEEMKAGYLCLRYEDGMEWKQIQEAFRDPDMVPLPGPGGDLSRNSRGYARTAVIFYVETKEVQDGERVRFREMVTHMDLCKKK